MNAQAYNMWKDPHFYVGVVLCALLTPLGGGIYIYMMCDRPKKEI